LGIIHLDVYLLIDCVVKLVINNKIVFSQKLSFLIEVCQNCRSYRRILAAPAASKAMEGSDEELNIPWLVDQYSQIQYHTTLVDPMIDRVEAQCKRLFLKDYNVEMLSNQGGELCGHYPRHLIIPTTYKEW